MSKQEKTATEHSSEKTKIVEDTPVAPDIDEVSVSLPSHLKAHSSDDRFDIGDSFYRSRLPKSTHWSVAWSDLMMTMFILFLTMFVYQASHQDFLVDKTPEIIGGDTTDGLDVNTEAGLIVPIMPITNTTPLIIGGTIKRVETVQIDDVDIDEVFKDQIIPEGQIAATETNINTTEAQQKSPEDVITLPKLDAIEESESTLEKDSIEQKPLAADASALTDEKQSDRFTEIYDMSKQTLTDNKMGNFASVELVRDTTMRIILTGDLLFSTGQADLSKEAKTQLEKISSVLKDSPYMINVIGHTDNQPMHSVNFATNWELSVVRASRVARFLIEMMGMNPQQFIVSGYGANRPRLPNSNIANRAANRRVEIIISKKLSPPVKASSDNLL